MNDVIGEIKSLEAAIELLGPARVHAKPLLTALKAAQERSKVVSIQERLDSCRQFIERAKKRVLPTDEVVARAVEQKAIFEAEVAQAELRLVLLQAETATTSCSSASRARSGQGVADTDRSSGAGARRRLVVEKGVPHVSTDAHVRSAGSGMLDVRSPERHEVRRFIIDLEHWRSGGARGWAAGDVESRCADDSKWLLMACHCSAEYRLAVEGRDSN